MTKPEILIITGFGLNCEAESTFAWRKAGAAPEMIHLNDLIERPGQMERFAALMFIGGFSYGDHMGSGLAFAQRVKHRLLEPLDAFIRAGKLIMGVCNGFQIMVKMGLLPGLDAAYFDPAAALIQNDCGHFQNYWVNLRFEANDCVFTRGIERMALPIRHGEGKLYTPRKDVLARIEQSGCVACRYAHPETGEPTGEYPHNPNGSLHAIAGLNDPTGRIFGLMPHPEAYLFPENHPHWPRQRRENRLPETGAGLQLFTNAVEYLRR